MTVQATNPFVGLRPFESGEDFIFFGREEQSLELLQRLHQHHFVAVIGSSGSGKSSLIKAGLIPGLQAGYLVNDIDRWRITTLKPGQAPLDNFARAILEQDTSPNITPVDLVEKIKEEGIDAVLDIVQPLLKDTNFFLLVDQFEELFRFSPDQKGVEEKDAATEFVNILLALSQQKDLPVYVVITMRSDFIGDCSQFFGLPEALNQSQYLVPRLTRTQLKTTIEGPVKLFKGKINPVLTARLLNDVQIVKDELPLLQHALMRVWDYEKNINKNGELDLKDYESIGGIEKALSNHADEALTGMTETELLLTKKIFQALTTIDENGRKIRRPVRLSELEAITWATKQQLFSLINRFIEGNRSFLVINKIENKDDLLLDISHESLIRQWSTLSGWVDEEAEAGKMYLRLVESAILYGDKKKDLMTGSELQLAFEWYKTFKPLPVWAERYNPQFEKSIQFLNESEKEWLAAEKRKKKYKQNKRILLFGLVIFGLVIGALAFIILQQKQLRLVAELQAVSAKLTAAEQVRLRANAESSSRNAQQRQLEADNSSKLAVLQTKLAEKNAANALIEKARADNNATLAFAQKERADNNALEAEKLALLAREAQQIAVDVARKVTDVKEGYRLNELAREWKEKDQTIALRIEEAAIQKFPNPLFATAARELYEKHGFYKIVAEHVDPFDIGSVLPQSKTLINDKGFRSLFYKKIPDLKIKGHNSFILAVSPDEEKIATCAPGNNIIKLWDNRGNFIKDFIIPSTKPHGYSVTSLKFSLDGKRLFAGYNANGSAGLWNTDGDGTPLWDMLGKPPYRHYINAAFSPDSKIILVSTPNGSVLWDIEEHAFVPGFQNIAGFETAVFSKDGKTICTGDRGIVSLWDMKGSLLNEYKFKDSAEGRNIMGMAFSETTNAIFALSSDSVIRSFNIYAGLQGEYTLPMKESELKAMGFSPGAKTILTYTNDKITRLWNENGKLQGNFKIPEDSVTAVSFSSTGNSVLIVSANEKASLWNINGTKQKEWNVQKGAGEKTTACAISPDETRIVTGTSDGTISIWDNHAGLPNPGLLIESKEKTKQYGITSAAFSPGGERMLIGIHDKWGHDTRFRMNIYTKNISMITAVPGNGRVAALSVDKKKVITSSGLFSIEDSISEAYYVSYYDFSNAIVLAFSTDGTKIISGYKDGSIRIWEAALTLEEYLRSDKVEALTEEQKKRFGIK
ncbi:MAG: hypothetical protein ABI760_11510 [Ferruginibacter sp.]